MLSDDPNEAMIASVMLPPPELGNLMDIENQIRIASSTVPGRDSLGKFILSEDYIGKLIPLLEVAEDLESLDNLHRLCNIMKMMILLNDTLIIEHIVMDEVVLGVVGILECKFRKMGNAICSAPLTLTPLACMQMTLTSQATRPITANSSRTNQNSRR